MLAGRLSGVLPLVRGRSRLTGVLATLVLAGTLVLGISPAVEAAPSADLQRYPYLTDLMSSSVTVNFGTVTTGTDAASVKWGPLGSCTANTVAASRISSFTVNGASRWQWKATIGGLSGDTQYCYRVFKGSTDLLNTDPSPSFRTQVPAGSSAPYSFVVFGDWGLGSASGNSHQTNLFNRMAASGARFALSTGDVPYGGNSQTWYGDLSYASSGVFGTGGWPLAGKSVALFNALGNHGRSVEYLNNWPSASAASTSGGRYQMDAYPSMNGTNPANYPSAWYAFDAGQIRFYVLDTTWSNSNNGTLSGTTSEKLYRNDYDQHWAPGRAELAWLQADLAANQGKAKIAVFHFPMWSANTAESSDTQLQGASRLEGLLTSNGVKLAFNGHAHHYQRSKTSALGLTQYVSGGGGAELHSISCGSTQQAFTNYAIAWSSSSSVGSKCPSSVPTPTSSTQVYHFIKVDVNGTNVTLTPTNESGGTFDVQTMNLAPSGDNPPTVSVTAPTEGASVSGTSVQLAATAGDDNGVAGVQFKVDGANVGAEDTSAPYEISWDSTAVADGTHTITAVARDTASQTSTSAPVNVTVANGGPPPTGINFVRQATRASTTGTTLNVPISATAGDTLVASIAVAAGSSKFVTGVTDSTGAPWTKGPVGFLSGANNHVEMWYRVNVPAGITQVTATLNTSGVSSATVSEWSGVQAVDTSAGRGNASSTTAATPTITTTNADDLIIGAINYPGAISSTLTTAGFTSLSNFNSGTSTNGRAAYRIVSSTGSYSVSWSLSAASTSGAAILALKGAPPPPSDTEDPTATVTSPAEGASVSGSINLTADASDNVGVAGVQFQVDGTNVGAEDTTAPYEATWDTTTATNGSHSVTAIARDAAGNTGTSPAVNVTVDNTPAPDTTPPGVSMTAPTNGAAVTGTIPVSANATDNVAVAGVQFKLDGANLGAEDTVAPYSINWDTSGVSEGTHTLTAVARDTATPANTAESAPVTVTVDRTQPTVSITSPTGGEVSGTRNVTANAADTGGSGVLNVQFKLDGNNLGSADNTSPYSVSWDTTTASNGPHTLTAVATDRAGNTTTSAQVNVTVNNVATGPAFVRQATGSISTGTALSANINATAGDALVASIAIAAGSSKSVASVTDSAGGTWTKGPVGFLSGSNSRVEIWFRTNVGSGISNVTATISASGAASMNVSEWSGVASASPVDQQASRGNASSTTAATPSITTTNASDVVIGAINYPAAATSTLTTSGFTSLNDFNSGSGVHGRAAHRVVSSTGAYSVSWTLSAASASGAAILALKGSGGGPPPPVDDPPTVSVTAPTAGSTVSGTAVSLEASANDDVGVASVQFKVDGVNAGAPDTTSPYQVNWDSTAVGNGSHTVTAVATDTGSQSTTSSGVSVTVDNGGPPPPGNITFVRQATASGSAVSLAVPITGTAAGNTLVASIALAAGSSKSVTSVTDSAGGTWTKGPVGFQTGANSRIEIWFRTGVGAGVTSVTATLSAAAAVSANVSEWSGVATAGALDASGGQGNAASTTASTPSVTTTNANDVVVGAINYPGAVTSTLQTAGFTGLTNFSSGTSTNGRAAYRIVTATGSYQTSWTLSVAAPSGGALLALKGA
jgi:Big-like domain-containing protein/calcineurin-like phosphoesterase family protein